MSTDLDEYYDPDRDKILELLDSFLDEPLSWKEGDITKHDLMLRYGKSDTWALKVMHRLKDKFPADWKLIKIRHPSGNERLALRYIGKETIEDFFKKHSIFI